jgi:hypothetical protein
MKVKEAARREFCGVKDHSEREECFEYFGITRRTLDHRAQTRSLKHKAISLC